MQARCMLRAMTRIHRRADRLRDMTRAFVQREVIPFAAAVGPRGDGAARHRCCKLGALGLFGVCAPAEWDGAGADFLAYMLMTEELAYGDAGICNMVNAANSFGAKVRDAGTPDQKERFLRPVASGKALGCLLMTEPHAGSDAAAMRTRAVRHGDSYVLNGAKCFITSGRSAEYAVIFAVTDPGAGKRGLSAFLTRTDRPGYRVVRLETKLGHRSNDTCQIALEDLEVPADRPARPARRRAAHRARPRWTARGSPPRRKRSAWHGPRTTQRSPMRANARPSASRSSSIRRSPSGSPRWRPRSRSRGRCAITWRGSRWTACRCVKEASMAKLFASQMSERVCSAAIQVHGGYGYVADFPVEKFYRDARVFQIYDGTNEVQKILISRELAAGRWKEETHEGADPRAGRVLSPRRLPVALCGAHARRDGRVPGRARALRAMARQPRAEGRHALALPHPRLPALLCRPRPQPAHPRRGRGPDRAGHPGVDQHLLHQGGARRRPSPPGTRIRPTSASIPTSR